MTELENNPLLLPGCWLVVLAASLILAATYAYQLAWGKPRCRPLTAWLSGVVASFLLCLVAGTELQTLLNTGDSASARISAVVIVAGVVLGSRLHFRAARCQSAQWRILTSPSLWCALLASLGVAARAGHHLHRCVHAADYGTEALPGLPPGQKTQINNAVALTDRGAEIPLFRWDAAPAEFASYSRVANRFLRGLYPAIPRAEADAGSNCHGWVFTGGEFLLSGDGVETIVRDHGYRRVDAAVAGDLVLYRNHAGRITHTGLVRGVLDDGTVMVESKWGTEGRYLHRAEDQPYGNDFVYLRSDRRGHRIRICRTVEPCVAATDSGS